MGEKKKILVVKGLINIALTQASCQNKVPVPFMICIHCFSRVR